MKFSDRNGQELCPDDVVLFIHEGDFETGEIRKIDEYGMVTVEPDHGSIPIFRTSWMNIYRIPRGTLDIIIKRSFYNKLIIDSEDLCCIRNDYQIDY